MKSPHFLLLAYPIQSHINPGLQFAKRLLQTGASVTFVTCVSAARRMIKGPIPEGLSFAAISDGYDDGYENKDGSDSIDDYLSSFRYHGPEMLTELIRKCGNEGRPVHHFVYTIMIPWAHEVARRLSLPCTCLWIQPATLFIIYYHYFHGYGNAITKDCKEEDRASWSLELPNLPFELKINDLPSFIVPSNPYTFAVPAFREQFEEFDHTDAQKIKPTILVNTFDALEPEALKSVEGIDMAGVGPLLPSAFLDGCDPSDTCFGADLFKRPKDYMKWLDSNPGSSVVYVSFGSISVLSKEQMQEVASALLECGRPFLWVIRPSNNNNNNSGKDHTQQAEEEEEDRLEYGMEELEQKGLIVPWCSQVEVLSHPSVGCFLTHCGWNSSLESLASGVPVVAFPLWSDQPTNAKLIEDVWKTGVRVVKPNILMQQQEEQGIVDRQEIMRCLDIVMESEDMRRNAQKWRELAVEAVKEGGSSDANLKAFVQEVVDRIEQGRGTK